MADESGVDVHYLRTRDDAATLTTQLAGRLTIIGGGWIGLELAAAARIAGGAVTVVEAASLPLVGVLGSEVAEVFSALHREHGVDLRTKTTALGLQPGADGTTVSLSDGTEIVADAVVVAIGAEPNIELAQTAGLACSNGIDVDARLHTDDPHIHAAGDVAHHDHPSLGRIRVEHWDNAMAQGRHAARTMLGDDAPFATQPYFFTDQYDVGMEYVGHATAADTVHVYGDVGTRAFRAYWTRDGQVSAGMHCNDWDATDTIRALVGGPAAELPR
jgi:NADPH-dependent 2,4-dienoyl-CoA reductase/sulfur reductase-like enzyme